MNFYEILKTKKLGRGSPDYWTQLFSEHVGGKGEWKVTGVLPLTFTAKAGNAVDWVIYGNDENGTENLWNEEWELGIWNINNGQKVNNLTNIRNKNKIPIESSKTYYWYNNKSDIIRFTFFDANGDYINNPIVTTKSGTVYSFTSPANAKFFCFYYGATEYENCVTLSTTPPDYYIPYQQGVGERTENLFDVSKIQEGTSINGGTMERNGTAITIHTSSQSNNTPDAKPSTLNDLTNGLLEIGKSYKLYITSTDTQRQYIYLQGANVAWNNRQLLEITQERLNSQVRWYAPSTSSTATISDMIICKASETIDHYIPYGYQIPLTVSQQGQTDKNYDIYIGDSPLTEDETVSKSSTGVDIELFEGENTVSTTLYNKPTMEIKYK